MSRKPIVYYKITRSGPKSNHKPEKALKSRERLLKRLEIEGETKWLLNALAFNSKKLEKYGLSHKVAA